LSPAISKVIVPACLCKGIRTDFQNQTPDMITQSRPNVKYFLDSIAAIKNSQKQWQAQNMQFIRAFLQTVLDTFISALLFLKDAE
jgi:hypothetical protein